MIKPLTKHMKTINWKLSFQILALALEKNGYDLVPRQYIHKEGSTPTVGPSK